MVKGYIKKIHRAILKMGRRAYYKRLRRKLKVTNPTIIASDCVGTFIYYNLGLKYCSPTINLTIPKWDFIVFVQHLSGFLQSELVKIEDPSVSYPIGKLEYNGNSIRINFIHYETFEEAKYKWDERKERVDYSNIYVIQHISDGVTEEDINSFDHLPYKKKLLIANENTGNSKNVIVPKVLHKKPKTYHPSIILDYKPPFFLRRYMDDIDYVGFLNAGK